MQEINLEEILEKSISVSNMILFDKRERIVIYSAMKDAVESALNMAIENQDVLTDANGHPQSAVWVSDIEEIKSRIK